MITLCRIIASRLLFSSFDSDLIAHDVSVYEYFNSNRPEFIGQCLLIVLLVKIFKYSVVSFFKSYSLCPVVSHSMSPGLQRGDLVLVNKSVTHLQRNDIVIFYYDGVEYVKRIVGMEVSCSTIHQHLLLFVCVLIYIIYKCYRHLTFITTGRCCRDHSQSNNH